jgi:S-adenosylmethionine hydrolase
LEANTSCSFEGASGQFDFTHDAGIKWTTTVSNSSPLALFGHSGLLEIGISQGSAARLFGLKVNEVIRIEFYAD